MEGIKNLGAENYRVMDWNKLIEQYPLHQIHQNGGDGGSGGGGGGGGGGEEGGGLYVKVMTDEQMEVLRRQISVYSTICEQLVEMHKSMTAQNDLTGIRMGNPYCDPSIVYGGNSISSRHRWTPTPVQLQVLERIFEEGSGTPSKNKIKDITSKLSKHGQISETNVYNWFQNRRARSKRKQGVGTPSNTETEVEIVNETKMKEEGNGSHEQRTVRDENVESQNPETSLEMHRLATETSSRSFPSDGGVKSSPPLGSLAWYDESFLRVDQLLMENMEIPGSSSPRLEREVYNILES